jgi:hypothetical protein
MARLFADENFPLGLVNTLRSLGHDILTVQEADMDNQKVTDEEVLSFAASQGRAVLTLNRRDFVRLHTAHPDHAGIIVCTQDADLNGQAKRIDQSLVATHNLAGQLLRIVRPNP